MIKNIFRQICIIILCAASFYLIDNKSSVSFTLLGNEYTYSYMEVVIYIIALYLFVELILHGVRAVVELLKKDVLISNHAFRGDNKSINIIHEDATDKIVLSRNQFDEAAILIVKSMSAITSGLMNDARRHLVNLRKIVGDDAIIDILMLKIYKGEKNFDKIEKLSQKLVKNEDIQLVGMKAALEVQLEKKEFTEALETANRAFEVRQDLYWVLSSAFLLRAKNNDWLGALEILESGIDKNLTPEHKAARLKSVALYELARQSLAKNDKVNFFKFVTQALNENNKLIPAALDLADYYVNNDKQKRKAENVLCNMWCANPSYEVAQAYLKLFNKDTKAERIQRMEKLALMNNKKPSLNNLILAELYIDARKYAKAKIECQLFLLKNPATEKISRLLHLLQEKSNKSAKKSKTAVDAIKQKISEMSIKTEDYPKDFQWVCANCNHTDDKWNAICPKCGEIGRNYWHLYVDNKSNLYDED